MEQILGKALSEAPGLAALCFIVWVFSKIAARFMKHLDALNTQFLLMHREHINARNETSLIVEKNANVMAQNTEAVKENTNATMALAASINTTILNPKPKNI